MVRVLIVDDEHDTVTTLAVLLAAWGHEIRKAYDGGSVVQQALAFEPQVVLLDIGLPKADGYDVARRLRRYKSLSNIKIVAVTGYASPADVKRAKDAGFDEHFAKPVDIALLKSYLDSVNPFQADENPRSEGTESKRSSTTTPIDKSPVLSLITT